jgi:hypothetical protein
MLNCFKPQASCLKPQASCLMPHASCFKPHASRLTPQASSFIFTFIKCHLKYRTRPHSFPRNLHLYWWILCYMWIKRHRAAVSGFRKEICLLTTDFILRQDWWNPWHKPPRPARAIYRVRKTDRFPWDTSAQCKNWKCMTGRRSDQKSA